MPEDGSQRTSPPLRVHVLQRPFNPGGAERGNRGLLAVQAHDACRASLLFQLHGDGVEKNAAAAAGVEGVPHCWSVADHTLSHVPMETTGGVEHAAGGKEEADGRDGEYEGEDGEGGLRAWIPCV